MYSICTCFLCRRAPGELEEHQQWGWVRPAGWPQLDLARPRPCCPTTSCCPTCCQHCCPGRHIAVGLPGSPSYTSQDQAWKRFLLKSLSQRKSYPKSLWKGAKKSAKSEQKNGKSPELVSWRFILFAFLENLYWSWRLRWAGNKSCHHRAPNNSQPLSEPSSSGLWKKRQSGFSLRNDGESGRKVKPCPAALLTALYMTFSLLSFTNRLDLLMWGDRECLEPTQTESWCSSIANFVIVCKY